MTLAQATGVCILCNVEVTEEDYRREIDCPSKTCPGRVYHEDCIAGYLKRTKYSKDRCTGFPCPAILPTGKPCPGYVCKMHNFFPSNQKKKQARLDAAIAAAALAKAKPVPVVKPKAGAQAAIAAIKRGATEGAQPVAAKVATPLNMASNNVDARLGNNAPQQPWIIPGLTGPIQNVSSREAVRAQVAKLRAEAKATGRPTNATPTGGTGRGAAANTGGAQVKALRGAMRTGIYSDIEDDQERAPHQATLWDAFTKAPGLGVIPNYLDSFSPLVLEKNNRNTGDKFSTRFKKRLLEGNAIHDMLSEGADGTVSENDSVGTSSTNWEADDMGSKLSLSGAHSFLAPSFNGEDFPALPTTLSALSITPSPRGTNTRSKPRTNAKAHDVNGLFDSPAATDVDEPITDIILQTPDEHTDDVILEYDMLYAAADGSYLVFDSVSNGYVRLEDMYGRSPEVVDCPAEDGNYYTCVAVRKAQQQIRMQWQQTWLQQNVFVEPTTEQPAANTIITATQIGVSAATAPAVPSYVTMNSVFPNLGGGAAVSPQVIDVVAQDAEDDGDTDVASLMQLLCV